MSKIEANVSGNAADWTPLGLLLGIYLFFFINYEKKINKGITKDYNKDMKKIKHDLETKSHTLSPLERRPLQENILTALEDKEKLEHRLNSRRNFIKILDRTFLTTFGIFGCHIIFTMCNLFSHFLPFIHLVGIFFTLLVLAMTCIIARYPRI